MTLTDVQPTMALGRSGVAMDSPWKPGGTRMLTEPFPRHMITVMAHEGTSLSLVSGRESLIAGSIDHHGNENCGEDMNGERNLICQLMLAISGQGSMTSCLKICQCITCPRSPALKNARDCHLVALKRGLLLIESMTIMAVLRLILLHVYLARVFGQNH